MRALLVTLLCLGFISCSSQIVRKRLAQERLVGIWKGTSRTKLWIRPDGNLRYVDYSLNKKKDKSKVYEMEGAILNFKNGEISLATPEETVFPFHYSHKVGVQILESGDCGLDLVLPLEK